MLYQGADLGRLSLVICSVPTLGLVQRPGWQVLLLTTHRELVQLLVHDETRGTTWRLVNVDDELR